MQRKALRYDKGGDQHYDYISAWIKSTRGSDPDASLYYLAAMLEGGEDARFIVRRMVILASRGRRQRGPAGAAGRGRRGPRRRARRAARGDLRARPGRDLPRRWRRSPTPPGRALGAARAHIREAGAGGTAGGAALGRLPGGAQARAAASATTTRTTTPGRSTTRSTCPPARSTCASTTPATASRSCASAWPGSGRPEAVTPELTAQSLWSLVPVASRARYIRRTAVAMLDELDDLARLLAEETGWPRDARRALRAAAGRARPAHARRPRPARARRPARDPARRVAGRAQHAASSSRRSASSACAARPPRRGASPRWRPPRRCWPATPCSLDAGARGRAPARRVPARGRAGRAA